MADRTVLRYEGRRTGGERLSPVAGAAPCAASVGVPRALYYFMHPGLWEVFFRELGLKVLVSDATTRITVERAGLVSEAEHCLPVKLLDAHMAEIASQADKVFVPRILSTLAGHIACPKLGALPDCARARAGRPTQVLTVDIDEAKVPLEDSLLELGRKIGADDATIRSASRRATEASRAGHRKLGARRGDGERRFQLLGHPYNIYDDYLSGPILRKLEALRVGVDLVAYDVEQVPPGPIKWDTCSIMHDTIRRLDPGTCRGVIRLSSFNCGCDSMVGEFFREMLRERGIPCMTLILDEHSGRAGLDTRLEAFVDSTGW